MKKISEFDKWFEDTYDYDECENVYYLKRLDGKYPVNFCVSDLEQVWDVQQDKINALIKIIKGM